MRPEPRTSFRTITLLTILPVAGFVIFFLWWWLWPSAKPVATTAQKAAVIEPVAPVREEQPAAVKAPGSRGSIAIILDDFGFEGQQIERAMALDPNISFSILPNGNRAADYARRLHARGYEVMCHLPMEPMGSESPGANAILISMGNDEIEQAVRTNVAAIPFAKGVNNHMGSRATSNRRVMETVIGALPQGMYFVDSRTAGGSVAESVAREKRVPTASRQVFLDDSNDPHQIRRQLAMLAEAAASRGMAIGIGHPRPATLDVLAAEIPRLRAEGFRFVRASQVVN